MEQAFIDPSVTKFGNNDSCPAIRYPSFSQYFGVNESPAPTAELLAIERIPTHDIAAAQSMHSEVLPLIIAGVVWKGSLNEGNCLCLKNQMIRDGALEYTDEITPPKFHPHVYPSDF